MTGPPCEFLEWDSAFFGVRIGRIHGTLLTRNMLAEIRAWSAENQVKCLYFFAQADAYETVRLAEESGFSLVDVRMTYQRQLVSGVRQDVSPHVRMFKPEDLASLREIAWSSHTDSRFYFDGNFPGDRCGGLFESWIERSCSGWAEAVLVGLQDNQPAGYITCHQIGERGTVGLAAVSVKARSRGLGTELVQSALEYFRDNRASQVKVVTQGRNRASQRLYQRCGFLLDRLELTYHWWL
jgi:dTDP-4-amino-4,6-dideoxy-D-galactose acyltransferase